MTRRILALALLLAGCDPCQAAATVHMQRCQAGDQVSCEWLDTHYSAAGQCH